MFREALLMTFALQESDEEGGRPWVFPNSTCASSMSTAHKFPDLGYSVKDILTPSGAACGGNPRNRSRVVGLHDTQSSGVDRR